MALHLDFRRRPAPVAVAVADPPLYSDPFPATSAAVAASRKAPGNLKQRSTLPSPNATADLHRLRQARAWDLAFAPAKQLPMQAFMLYMTGSGVQIFSVMTVYMLIKNAFAGAVSVSTTFSPFEPPVVPATGPDDKPPYDLTMQKLAYVACQGLLLALGLWKVNGMGLLPTRTSDWVMYTDKPWWAERSLIQDHGVMFS